MSALTALKAARACGVRVETDGNKLSLRAATAPPPDVVALLSTHKSEVIALLKPRADGRSAEDWLAFFDERAGIAEVDGGLPRDEAEARAYEWCLVEWLNRNWVRSPAGRCLHCGEIEHAHDPLLPFGAERLGHAWVHSNCWSAWQANRKAQAIESLAKFGIEGPRQGGCAIDAKLG